MNYYNRGMKRTHSRYNPFRATIVGSKVRIHQRIQQSAFYFTCITLLLIIPWEIYKVYYNSGYGLIVYLIANFLLVIVAMIMYIKMGDLYYPQRLLLIIIVSIMFTIFNMSGGQYSMPVLYLLVAFPVFIVLFDTSLLIALSSFYFLGMLFMFKLDEFSPQSIFYDNAVRVRFYPVLVMSYFVGILTSLGFNKLIKTLSLLAFTDGICNFSNRERFIDLLKQHIKQSDNKRFSVIGIRIKSFSELETQLDFDVINTLLLEISNRIKRFHFVINSRWNNSTFLCVFPLNSTSYSKEVVVSLLKRLEEVYELRDNKWTLRFQIGVSTYPDNSMDADALISSVLATLNSTPKQHGNIIYNEDIMESRSLFSESLTRVLQGGDFSSEFSLLYRPVVLLESSKTVGVEAVIRWDSIHNSTAQLIKFAEDRGVIQNITRWVIEKVFKQISNDDSAVFYSIHISVLDLKDVTFIPYVINLIQKYTVDTKRVDFIVSEQILIDQDHILVNSLNRLEQMNFSLTLDEYGSHCTGLEQLMRFPLKRVKINKKFIQNISHKEETQRVVRSIISLAEIYKFQVVAKGVNTNFQKEFLIRQRCDFAQGLLFNK